MNQYKIELEITKSGPPGPIGPTGKGLEGSNFILVAGDGTPVENGTELTEALSNASAMTPGGNPLSSENRVTVLVAPGNYEFDDQASSPVLDTPFVDLVSLTGERDLIFDLTNGS